MVVEATVADCSTRPVQRMKTLVVRTLVVCVVVHSADCCRAEVDRVRRVTLAVCVTTSVR